MEELGLPGIWGLTPLAALTGVITLLYWLLATGRLITKGSHEREIGIYKDQVDALIRSNAAKDNQINSLMSVGRTVQAVLRGAGPDVVEDTEPDRGT